MYLLRRIVSALVVFLHECPVWALGLLSTVGVCAILLNFLSLAEDLNRQLATQYASLFTTTMAELRKEYDESVSTRVESLVLVTDDYKKHVGAIPFPATFSIELADRISRAEQTIGTEKIARIYSDYPFPSRQESGGPQDDYERQALVALRQQPCVPFVRIDQVNGRRALRFASAIQMDAHCVACHNSRPGSPRQDWKVGDVRGVQEIIMPLDSVLATTLRGLSRTLLSTVAMAFIGVGLLALVVNKLRGSLQTVKNLALKTEEANRILLQTNIAYDRFVPHEFLRFLNKQSILDVELGDNIQQEMTILFSDIRSFTTISETMKPEENFQFLNDYLSAMGPIVRDYQGFIDKYIGDGIMALFMHPDDALDAAITMLQKLPEYNRSRSMLREVEIKIGVGLNTGMLMLGTIGESNRMEGTVISDAVNLASRMEGLTKLYGTSLLLSQHTYNKLRHPERYLTRIMDRVRVKGKHEPIAVYEVCYSRSPEVRSLKTTTWAIFAEALFLYERREFHKARELFTTCVQQNPDDHAAELFINRCTYFLQTGCPMDWDGVMELDVK